MRTKILLVLVVMVIVTTFSTAALAHLSNAQAHYGRYLWSEATTSHGRLDPINLGFYFSTPDYTTNHHDLHFPDYHSYDWYGWGDPLNWTDHGRWEQPMQQRSNDCYACERDHIRFYAGQVDADDGAQTIAAVHFDKMCDSRHVGMSFNFKRQVHHDRYRNTHYEYYSLWNNIGKTYNACMDAWYGGDGEVMMIHGGHS